MTPNARPIGIYYEHPEWFRPLFAELDRRGMPYVRARRDPPPLRRHQRRRQRVRPGLQPHEPVGPSARPRPQHPLHAQLPRPSRAPRRARGQRPAGVPDRDVEGAAAGAAQVAGAAVSGRARHQSSRAGAGGRRRPALPGRRQGQHRRQRRRHRPLRHAEDLARAVRRGPRRSGLDQTALVQEFIPARGGHITRVEVLAGRYLYAIDVYRPARASICARPTSARNATGRAGPRGLPGRCAEEHLRVEGYDPARRGRSPTSSGSSAAAGIEVGGVEYIVDDRDGQRYYYDINALSNFVADAPRVVGFDPFVRLVDFLERERGAGVD